MIHNIFSSKKQRGKTKQKLKTPLIIADIHEKNSLVLANLHESKQIRLDIKPLKIGDYLLGPMIIERKTVRDFIGSMLNKRLVQQLKQMKKYKQQLLIIEGTDESDLYDSEINVNPNAIRGFILSILTNFQTPIIFTQNEQDTAKYLITLARQQLKPSTPFTLHQRIPKKIKEQKQYILESFPNIGPQTASKLLKKFKTLKDIFNANEKDLEPILKSKTKQFLEIIKD
ncbi:hypothetical protein GOV14_00895 [Candidatus Pacearchaeota archaeon]|nr:hypothetical protein [Candidatus Pacearchaeota archaeon]